MNTDTGSVKIATVGGIDLKVHWSWAIIALMITFELAAGYFPAHVPDGSSLAYWILGLITALLLFASLLLHELSHSFMARARGLPVSDITLFIFGGVSSLEREPESAGDEFAVAIVGPLTSFFLAGLFFGLAQIVAPVNQLGESAVAVLHDLAFINLLLGAFNLIPGFPLDGGRVLRSIVWALNHDFKTATRVAAFVGQVGAYGFILLGLYETFIAGDFGGLWIAFIGWFLLGTAGQSKESAAEAQTAKTLREVTAGQVMGPAPEAVEPHVTLAYLLNRYVLPHNLRYVPVADSERFIGFITLSDIKDVPQDQWGTVRVGELMRRTIDQIGALSPVHPNDPFDRAWQLLSAGDVEQLPVVDLTGRLVGVLDREHVSRWLQVRDALKLGVSQ